MPASSLAPNLETERLLLRALAPRDAEPLFTIMRDPGAMRFWDMPPLRELETMREILASQLAEMQSGHARYWAVSLKGTPGTIGACDLSEIDHYHRRAELGFLFHPSWWGNGYACEAMRAIIAHTFATSEIERLWARLHAGNEACARLLERLGFSYEGRLFGHVLRDGERRDCLLYGRLKGD